MSTRSHGGLKPRKQPVQARSQATIEAVFEATIQVLLAGGARALTTNHIADKAGVSIGTLYQYFPGKEALLYALVRRHLDRACDAVERACDDHGGASLDQCADVFVDAYIDAKAGDVNVSRALYYASAELDLYELSTTTIGRLRNAVERLLAGSGQIAEENLSAVVFSWVAIVTGGTRLVLEAEDTSQRLPIFRHQLKILSRAYLQTVQAEDAGERT